MSRFAVVTAVLTLTLAGSAVPSAAQVARPGAHAGPAAGSARAEPGFAPDPIRWGPCGTGRLQRRGAECGYLTVPLDYADPARGTIRIAVSRVRHTVPAARYQGVMLTNPGGPGGSGLALSVLGDYVPKQAGAAYDWIGFDPRGVGASEPRLACHGGHFGYNRPYYVPVTASLEQTWLQRATEYARACATAGGPLLNHLKTTDTVADMESLRQALGRQQINFYGFSYGSYLGQVYATLHPDRVRRMVLDGNVDARRVWYAANLDQDVAFDRNMKVFFGWIAKHHKVYRLGTSAAKVERRFYAEQLKLRTTPAGGVIGPDEWTDLFLTAGYYVHGWLDVAAAFSGWVHRRDWQSLKALYDGANPQGPGTDNGYAVYLATQCTDTQWPASWRTWRRDNRRTHAKAPFVTWANAWFNAPCRDWAAPAGKPVEVDGSAVAPILLISETRDGATPFEGSLEVRSRFRRAVLIEGVGGTTHAGSLSGVACTDNRIADYLATGALPARLPGRRSDVRCSPVPRPVPARAALTESRSTAGATDLTRADLQQLIGPRRRAGR
ncbi:MAG TPA: alpha/beta fold hydrolase [Actinoplanes sp.]|nr:alpha/beta fold hydrolase [Actinoplanes sp.]